MRTNAWLRILVVVAAIMAGGALLALAGLADDGPEARQRVVVQVNDVVETIELEDLTDGETREFDAGDHTVAVTRVGDRLSVWLDGEEVAADLHGSDQLKTMLWVEDEEGGESDVEKLLIMKKAGAEGSDVRTYTIRTRKGEGTEEIDVDVEAVMAGDLSDLEQLHASHHEGAMIFTSAEPGAHPIVVAGPGACGDMVRYRCEDSGSELLVPKDAAVSESYICPATGCVMTRVEEPEVHIVKVVKHRASEDSGGD